ncbi:MAG: helix-turn-helix transcriptional regulator [Cytophagales bacterium]|nr:helix-turn-helix transcriptional regulator [Cytophagales bacterium]
MLKNQKIGTKIRRFRESKEYTQEYMASLLNISQNSYSRLEKDPKNMPLTRLEEICQILEINLKDLIDGKESSVYFNNNEAEYQNSYGNIVIHNYPKELMDSVMIRLERIEENLKKSK